MRNVNVNVTPSSVRANLFAFHDGAQQTADGGR